MKTNEKSLVDFNAHVKSDIAATIANAKGSGISDADIDAIITRNYEEHPTLGIGRVVSRIRKLLLAQIEIKSATIVKGCIVGSRDKFGKNSPIRYLLLKPDKKHIEISHFGYKTPYKIEEEYPIPVPSLLSVRVTADTAFHTWNLNGIEEITRGPLDKDTLISVMGASEIQVNTITKEMTYDREKERPATPVVIYGKIAAIQNEVVFKERENRSDKAEVERTLNVWESTEDGFKPCFSFAIRGSGGRFVRCHIEHQRYGRPTLMIEDINEICERAFQKYPNDPKAQANYLNDWLGDLDVLVAGVPSSFRESFDKEKRPTTNIEIGVAAVVEVKERVPGHPTQTTVTQSKPSQPVAQPQPPVAQATPVAPPVVEKKPEKPPVTQDKIKELAKGFGSDSELPTTDHVEPAYVEPAPAPLEPLRPSDGGPTILVKSIMSDIKLWCKAANIDPASVTGDLLKSKAANRYGDIPAGTIMEVVDRIKNGE